MLVCTFKKLVCIAWCTEFNLCCKMQFSLFPNILAWTVKNVSKQKCGQESINVFSMTTKMRNFENALVLTGC